jgi:hypothetical protein
MLMVDERMEEVWSARVVSKNARFDDEFISVENF